MILELAEGGTLSTFMKERFSSEEKFSDEETARIIKNILLPIFYLHRKNIIHRDIKPGYILFLISANILLMKPCDISSMKLTDFGLSVQLKAKNLNNYCFDKCGTLLYMAPECMNDSLYSKVNIIF